MTFAQRNLLKWLDTGPQTVHALALDLTHTGISTDAIRASLRRMEDRGWVRRIWLGPGWPTRWELSAKGRKALEDA